LNLNYTILKKGNLIIPLFLCCCLFASLTALARQDGGGYWQDLYTLKLERPVSSSALKGLTADEVHAVMTFGLVKAVLFEGRSDDFSTEDYQQLYDQATQQLEELPDSDPRQSHYLADLHLSRALLHLREGNTLRGGWQIRKAIRLLAGLSESFPRYYDHLPLYGLLQGALATVPDQYQWALPTLGITVEAKNGRTIMLEGLAKGTKDHTLKGTYLMALADMYLFGNPGESTHRLEKLLVKNPGHSLARHMLAKLYLKDFNAEGALTHLNHLVNQCPDSIHPMPSVHYMKGEALLRKGNYPEAIGSFGQFLEMNKGTHLVKDAYYKQGLAWYILGNEEKMNKALQNALLLGEASTGSDKYALKIASGEEALPDSYLVEARLRTDGGYLDEADQLLNERIRTAVVESMPVDEATEWHYRKARVAHLQGDTVRAKKFYARTITMQQNHQYYAPNACLQLGILHKEKAPEEARIYFNKAIAYSDHPYESEIEQKAKAALKELPE
jgi:tetratricopeptide (TPR) repeat protein